MLVSGGENVFPAEIEELLRRHPDVVDVAVGGAPDERWGQRVQAFVVRRPRSRLDADAVRDHVRGRLASFKVPRDVVFVASVPRNATGKVIRRELSAAEEVHGRASAGNGSRPAPARKPRRARSTR
jgi:fatty-acyl-CoA synthase